MAFLGGTFDASTVEPSAPIENLPPGKYVAQIIESEMKETKAGGEMLTIIMEIMEGHARGRKLRDNLNLVNASEKAQSIAKQTLSAICHAVGKLQVSDSEALHFLPMSVTLAVEPDNRDAAKLRNVVKGYAATSEAGAAPAHAASPAPAFQSRPAAGAQASKPAPAGKAPPPWAR